ncbi:MAG: DNA translocase FtsK [Planctomycetes bacterium]|nr:DNA translocase FtsK [Planctomycetota bacterium]
MENKKNQANSVRAREIIGLAFIITALFIFVTLITHRASDYGGLVYPASEETHNKGGLLGAFLSYHLIMNFGLASYVLAGMAAFWGVILFWNREIKYMWWKIASANLLVFSSAAFFGMLFPELEEGGILYGSTVSMGGTAGLAGARIIMAYLGGIGGFPAVCAVILVSLLFATDWLVQGLYSKMWAFAKSGSLWFAKLTRDLGIITAQKTGDLAGQAVQEFEDWRARKAAEKPASPALDAPLQNDKKKNDYIEQVQVLEEKPVEKPVAISASPRPVEIPAAAEHKPEKTEPAPKEPVYAEKPRKERVQEHREKEPKTEFKLPPVTLLEEPLKEVSMTKEQDFEERKTLIEKTLESFGIIAKIVDSQKGPVLTKYEVELAQGTRSHKIVALSDDLGIALKAPNVAIAPVSGKNTIGIDVPNTYKDIVRLKELISASESELNKAKLPLFLGKDVAGKDIVRDLAEMPHLLVAGATGSGKSVCLNSIIMSLLMAKTPEQLKLILIDPKMVELSAFKDVPHLMSPVITEMKKAPLVLNWVVQQMEERYELLAMAHVKKIESYNQLGEKKIRELLQADSEEDGPADVPVYLPRIVVVVDELADLMLVASSKDIESTITRIAQKSRAVGIHMILATQRPSVDIITGLIKSNITARIAFKTAAKVDSRTILDRNGADMLLGQGDMLMLMPNTLDIIRAQCTYSSEKEIQDITGFWKGQGAPQFDKELDTFQNRGEDAVNTAEKDEFFEEAVKVVLETQRGSVSLLQRKLGIGYTRAARLIEYMANVGILGGYKEAKARDVCITPEEWEARRKRGDYSSDKSGSIEEDDMVGVAPEEA